ncbi:aryl-sulfate sulfotransferase [Pontimicrobium sp. IMCC45349]|uniref:aryl-sulfate sulfotransferase n=1 Tax=Pontimicrobium sp. IMCC45349 TaxID=3391574 RepID=UPI0039A0A4E4
MKRLKPNFLITVFFLSLLSPLLSFSQNTVGIIDNQEGTYGGYTLITKNLNTYLINNCGEIINQWTSDFNPGNAVYLLENGNLLRACKTENTGINFGGVGGRIELRSWDNDLLWEYNYSTPEERQHHDIYPMPNGNILMLAVSVLSNEEAIQAGRNPSNLTQSTLYNEHILELEPIGTNSANIVWEWHIKDHLIQDFDINKDNYGIVENNPQLLDINYLGGSNGNSNWLHINSLQYDESLDQIVLSSRLMSEIYIIDHSTTTEEAASNNGGIYGKGGDFLYRWGNPEVYKRGDENDKKLFGQHYPYVIPPGYPNEGKIILFNNGLNRSPSFSEVYILNPPQDIPGFYNYEIGTTYGPETPDYIYQDPEDPTNFFSHFLSGAQMLPNGNILVCVGSQGYLFEINSENQKVWKYISPVGSDSILSQGDDPLGSGNTLFRATKYGYNYPAFDGRDLTPELPIENNPDLSQCDILNIDDFELNMASIYPNPVKDKLNVKSNQEVQKLEIYNLLGKLVLENSNSNSLDMGHLTPNLYLLKIHSNNTITTKKIIKQ